MSTTGKKGEEKSKLSAQPKIQHFFLCTRAATAWATVSETRGKPCIDIPMVAPRMSLPSVPGRSDVPELREVQPGSAPEQSNTKQTGLGELDLKALLQALPTRSEMEATVSRLEEVHRKDLQMVRTEVQVLVDRFTIEETAVAALEDRVSRMERADCSGSTYIYCTTSIGKI